MRSTRLARTAAFTSILALSPLTLAATQLERRLRTRKRGKTVVAAEVIVTDAAPGVSASMGASATSDGTPH